MNIYVGNVSYGVTEEDLKEAFESFGEVQKR
jgi:RNA recognition motif-containing protein